MKLRSLRPQVTRLADGLGGCTVAHVQRGVAIPGDPDTMWKHPGGQRHGSKVEIACRKGLQIKMKDSANWNMDWNFTLQTHESAVKLLMPHPHICSSLNQ